MKRYEALFKILFFSLALGGPVIWTASCQRNIEVTPSPVAYFTKTYTATSTSTSTQTFTPTTTPTITETSTPTITPTSTATSTATFVCTVNPPSPTLYTEMEPIGVQGINDSCATAENLGVINGGGAVVVHGSSASTGGGSFSPSADQDYYTFTVGTTAQYTFTLDCFSSGADTNLMDIVIFDNNCNYVYDPGAGQPVLDVYNTLNAGDVWNVMVFPYNGTAPMPYRLTISSP